MTSALLIASDPDGRALSSTPTLRLYGERVDAFELGLPELPAPLVRTDGWRMKEAALRDGDVVDGGTVTLRFLHDVPDPLLRVAAMGSWIAVDVDHASHDHRCRAIRWHANGVAQATLAFGNAYALAAGVSLARFFRRAGDSLPLEIALRLVRDAWAIGAPHAVVTWDGAVVALPHRASERADELDRAHELLGLLGVDRIAALDADAEDRSLLHDATNYDLFDALILVPDVKRALDAVHSREVRAEEVAEMARALFPDEWRDERNLREELATLDAAGLQWLMRRSSRQ